MFWVREMLKWVILGFLLKKFKYEVYFIVLFLEKLNFLVEKFIWLFVV